MTELGETEVARRLPLWCALADLFLDTDMPEHWIASISTIILRDGWSLAEAEDILRWEVRPAFYFNLLDVAGEWAGWHEDDVRRLVLAARQPTGAKRLLLGKDRFMPGEIWQKVVEAVGPARGDQPNSPSHAA